MAWRELDVQAFFAHELRPLRDEVEPLLGLVAHELFDRFRGGRTGGFLQGDAQKVALPRVHGGFFHLQMFQNRGLAKKGLKLLDVSQNN